MPPHLLLVEGATFKGRIDTGRTGKRRRSAEFAKDAVSQDGPKSIVGSTSEQETRWISVPLSPARARG